MCGVGRNPTGVTEADASHPILNAVSAALSLYIPVSWNTSIPEVLKAAGFEVSSRDRRFGHGSMGREHACKREAVSISLTEAPLPSDTMHFGVLGICRRKHADTLLYAAEALYQRGAIDDETYKQRSHHA